MHPLSFGKIRIPAFDFFQDDLCPVPDFFSNWGEKTRQKLAMFLAPFTILPFTSSDAFHAGIIRAHLEKQGAIIGPYDVQLAGQAISRDLIFVTHNTGEFNRVPNLRLEDWVV